VQPGPEGSVTVKVFPQKKSVDDVIAERVHFLDKEVSPLQARQIHRSHQASARQDCEGWCEGPAGQGRQARPARLRRPARSDRPRRR
jgi:hypothetical protein